MRHFSSALQHPEGLLWRAATRLELGDAQGALRDSASALARRSSTVGLVTRGAAKRRLGDFAGAVEDCDEALRLEPRRVEDGRSVEE